MPRGGCPPPFHTLPRVPPSGSTLSGIASGVKGIVVEPVNAVRKGDGLGWGLFRGVVGAVVKPVAGVIDGITNSTEEVAALVADKVCAGEGVQRGVADRGPVGEQPPNTWHVGPHCLCTRVIGCGVQGSFYNTRAGGPPPPLSPP